MPKRNASSFDRLALRVLIDAAARSKAGAVERTWGHRLALTHLVRAGFAERWQAKSFWESLSGSYPTYQWEHEETYIASTMLFGCINTWSYAMGLQPPDLIEMSRIARPYMSDLETEAGTQDLPCMCNRYRPGERDTIRSLFDAKMFREVNDGPEVVHPKDPGWVIRSIDGQHVLDQMTWGFPTYIRGKGGAPLKPRPTNNARIEKLGGYWARWGERTEQRCLIPTASWAEAVGPAGSMTTTWLSLKDAPMFAWAGLWTDSDEWGSCYTGVMTDAAPEMLSIHDRSPVILRPEEWHTWLTAPLSDLKQFDRRFPAAEIKVDATRVLWASGKEAPPNMQAPLPPIDLSEPRNGKLL